MTPRSAFRFTWLMTCLIGLGANGQAQIPTGTWQDQANFTRGVDVAVAPGGPIALVAAETAVFALTLDEEGRPTGELQRFGKAQGLSRADIAAVALAPEANWAIVAHAEGTFDLVALDVDGALTDVTTVTDLSEADLLGDKRPRKLVVVGDRLLICTDIGVVEFDLVAVEVRDTWKLEAGGQPLAVRAAAQVGDQWHVATSAGVWSAPQSALFLGNPATWTLDEGLASLGVTNVTDFIVLESGARVVLEEREGANALWHQVPGGPWIEWSAGLEEEWRQLATDGVHWWASTPFGLMKWDAAGVSDGLQSQVGNVYLEPQGLSAAGNGLWLANAHSGVLRLDAAGGGFEGPFAPNGPRTNACYRLDAWNDILWVATGGTDASGTPLYRQEGFSGRKGNWWRRIAPPAGEAGAEGIQDPMDVSIDPTDPERAVFGSLEEGLVEIRGKEVVDLWNPDNSPLEWNTNWSTPRCAVPALDFDRQGNLWVANEGTEFPLKMLDVSGEWHVFGLEGLDPSIRITRVFATQSDQVWLLLGDGEGIAVIATEGTPEDPTDDDIRFLGQGEGQGGLPSSFVYAVEEDLDGEIWVGTLQGPAVFYQPAGLFSPDPIDAQQILIEQDGNFQFLLETETVQDIALDGGNRKWLATVNNGVFLLSPDGREQEAHFTAANSPLPADEVYDVALDQASGLVFFATPNGVTSFRGSATNFQSELGQRSLSIFPNPWRPEYAPVVTIDGLAFGTEVHIVNGAGQRVRQLDSDGGRAVWDTLDEDGRPVPEGVYFTLVGEAARKTGGSGKLVILRR